MWTNNVVIDNGHIKTNNTGCYTKLKKFTSDTCKAFESRIELNKDDILYWDKELVFGKIYVS